jgi:hypothetical protein
MSKPQTAEQRAEAVLRTFWHPPGYLAGPTQIAAVAAAIREAEAAATARERESILRTLRVLHDEHSPTDDWARGIRDAVACVEARADRG